jgi:hypothetical protein
MIDNSHLEVYHRTAKVRKGGSEFASALFFVASLFSLAASLFAFALILIPFGLVLLACATLVRSKYKKVDWCDACGNHISPTCLICPTCHAKILTPLRPLFWTLPVKCAVGFVAALILILGIFAVLGGSK